MLPLLDFAHSSRVYTRPYPLPLMNGNSDAFFPFEKTPEHYFSPAVEHRGTPLDRF